MTWMDANRLAESPRATEVEGPDAGRCPFDPEDIAVCPDNRPGPLAEQHRRRVDCRYLRVRTTPDGPVAACTRGDAAAEK